MKSGRSLATMFCASRKTEEGETTKKTFARTIMAPPPKKHRRKRIFFSASSKKKSTVKPLVQKLAIENGQCKPLCPFAAPSAPTAFFANIINQSCHFMTLISPFCDFFLRCACIPGLFTVSLSFSVKNAGATKPHLHQPIQS